MNSEIYELLMVIVDYDKGSKVLKISKESGITGGTIFLGKGTVPNKILQFLEIADVRKEIVVMVGRSEIVQNVISELHKTFHFEKKNKGICFTLNVENYIGGKIDKIDYEFNGLLQERGFENMYSLITVIVERGRAEDVITSSKEMGARGGTIINARGSGIHETEKVFGFDIEPEKEVVLILVDKEKQSDVVSNIEKDLQIKCPGAGIMFVQDVNKAYGVY